MLYLNNRICIVRRIISPIKINVPVKSYRRNINVSALFTMSEGIGYTRLPVRSFFVYMVFIIV